MPSHFIQPPVSTTWTIVAETLASLPSSSTVSLEPVPVRHGSLDTASIMGPGLDLAQCCSTPLGALLYCTLWSGDCCTALCGLVSDCCTALCGLVTVVLHFVVWWLLYCTLWSGDCCCTALCGLVTDCCTALCGLVTVVVHLVVWWLTIVVHLVVWWLLLYCTLRSGDWLLQCFVDMACFVFCFFGLEICEQQ